jgi:hypothetical protein
VRRALSMPVDVEGDEGWATCERGRATWVWVRWGADRRAPAADASRIRGAFGLLRPRMRRDAASTRRERAGCHGSNAAASRFAAKGIPPAEFKQ